MRIARRVLDAIVDHANRARPAECCGILLASSEMQELQQMADRILVMRRGRITGEIANDHDYEKTSEQIMGFIH